MRQRLLTFGSTDTKWERHFELMTYCTIQRWHREAERQQRPQQRLRPMVVTTETTRAFA